MIPVWGRILEAIDRHGAAAMVTVASARGSSPREPGARMIVNPDGSFTGTIGGGALEWRAIALAQAALGRKPTGAAELKRFALGPELGQCCGGQVELLVETFGRDRREAVADLAGRESLGPFATESRIAAGGLERRLIADRLPPGAATLAAGIFREGFGDDRRALFLFGAGHVGRALVLALAPLPFAVTWIDPRPDAFPAHVPANVAPVGLEDPAAVLASAGEGAFVLAMSHSHRLDLALVHAALADGRFPFVGLIGSDTKRARFEKRLAEAGIPRERIDALICPIGIGGIRSKLPAAIAAATAAQLLAADETVRAGSTGESESSPIAASRLG